ncbi:MAG: mechanosensitive ion channel family protein [Verrucomicrobia bacterium]|nr:mechanosensitive ion channel family protein [Verrucomicrobiota bacterium]
MTNLLTTLQTTGVGANEWWRILTLFGSILAGLAVGQTVKYFLSAAAKRLDSERKPIVASTCRAIGRSSLLVGFGIGLRQGVKVLVLGEGVAGLADDVTQIVVCAAVGFVVYCLVDVVNVWLTRLASRTASKLDDMLVPMVRKSLKVTVVVLVLVQIAQALSDKPITSIIAGLGVGGIAIALAAQDTLKNFFGSLVIFADKPFELGDRIVVDSFDGPVEEVGFRSTRIRTLDGHLVTVPNADLANKIIQNIGKRPYIKRVMNIMITYDTPPEKVDRAVEILKDILKDHEGMKEDFPPRVFFNEFNDSSLNIMVLYWFHPPDYWAYCAFNEKVNMEILRRFSEEGIDFAFPSQTTYLAGDPGRPLTVGIEKREK